MTEPHSDDTLDDVLTPTEHPTPDRGEHAKTPKHLNDDELEHRAEHERDEARSDHADG